MVHYNYEIKKYALTLGLTPGILWLIGGLLGVYFSKENTKFLSAIIIGGLPIITTIFAVKFNILGSIILILESLLILIITYYENIYLPIIILLFLSYSLPLLLSGISFIRYWYKNKTRI